MNLHFRLLVLCLLSTFLIAPAYSQTKKDIRKAKRLERKANTHKYRSPIMVYPIYWGIQDTRTTPGIYRVFGAGAAIRMKKIRPKFELEHIGQFNLGLGSPNFEKGALQYNTQFHYEANYIRKINQDFSAGINGFGFFHSRITPALSNSSFASEGAFGIGPIGRFTMDIRLFKKETNITVSASFPLITYVNRVPEFGLSFTGTNSIVAPIGRFNKLSIRIDAKRLFKNSTENTINYFYRWEYYGMEEFEGLHNLRVASHQIGFHLWIKRN